MKRTTAAISLLSLALLASNAYWAYTVLDNGVSYTYLNDSYRKARGTALQAIAILPVVARPDATRESVVAAARAGDQYGAEPFEKEGYVWVGDIGLQFDQAGRLVAARPAVEPF